MQLIEHKLFIIAHIGVYETFVHIRETSVHVGFGNLIINLCRINLTANEKISIIISHGAGNAVIGNRRHD